MSGGIWVECKTGKVVPKDEPIDTQRYLAQVDDLQVGSQCSCGAPHGHLVQFQNYATGKSVGLVTYHTDDMRMFLIHVNTDTGKLAELDMIQRRGICRTQNWKVFARTARNSQLSCWQEKHEPNTTSQK